LPPCDPTANAAAAAASWSLMLVLRISEKLVEFAYNQNAP
jgi:hypothetical protein